MTKKIEKILVTGGCGFIGSEVVKQLLVKGYQVRVVDNLSKIESSIKSGYEFIQADLADQHESESAFSGMDVCINLAAKIGGIGYFHKYPATIISENNRIYSATFSAAVKSHVKRMVYISSSMVYESTDQFPSREDDVSKIPPPVTSYGFSKLTGEWYCRAFAEEFGLEYTICRPFNAYGVNEAPGEEVGYAHVIPDLVKKIFSGQYPLEILGDGSQTRCFTHVSDVASGIIAAMESDKAVNEAFNISNPRETSMLELAKLLWAICGQSQLFKATSVNGFNHDIKRRVPDTTKAKNFLGWEAKINLETGLAEVASWLKGRLKV